MIAQSSLALPIATILEKEKKRKDLIFSRDFFRVSLCCASAGCRRPGIASQYNIFEQNCQEKSQLYNISEIKQGNVSSRNIIDLLYNPTLMIGNQQQ